MPQAIQVLDYREVLHDKVPLNINQCFMDTIIEVVEKALRNPVELWDHRDFEKALLLSMKLDFGVFLGHKPRGEADINGGVIIEELKLFLNKTTCLEDAIKHSHNSQSFIAIIRKEPERNLIRFLHGPELQITIVAPSTKDLRVLSQGLW